MRTRATVALIAVALAAVASSAATPTAMHAAQRSCTPAPIHRGAPPAWTAAAWTRSSPQIPYALASGDAAAAFFFAPELRAGHPTNPSNKVLWIVRRPRNGSPLVIVAHPATGGAPTVRLSLPADSEPGEIYPSAIDLPTPGCWRLQLRWDGNAATIDVKVHPAAARPRATRAAQLDRPLRLPRVAPGGRCPVSRLHPLGAFVAPGLGGGPVYPVLGGTTLRVVQASRAAWDSGKVLWIASAAYAGPVLIRGRELDGPRPLRFGHGRETAAAMRLDAPGAASIGEPAGWREWPSITRVPTGGCYAYQVDGTSFSAVVVFRAALAPPAAGS